MPQKVPCFLLMLLYIIPVWSQAILAGVINKYTAVTSIDHCRNGVVVSSAAAFSAGDQAILIQMKGASMNTSDSPDFGNITRLGHAGRYEKVIVSDVNGNLITFQNTLKNTYEVSGLVQLVTMPVFEQAIVRETVQPKPWDGNTGGVVAFEVSNTLILEADIDASGAGFRGGQANIQQDGSCNFAVSIRDYARALGDWRGGAKGEGIVSWIANMEAGRGPQANGGGGGNDHNSGGGGGANVSRAGKGGRNAEPSFFGCKGNFPGEGGNGISPDTSRLYLGGGGGAGHENNDVATSGGAGGGIILLVTSRLTPNEFAIRANGEDAGNTSGDGGGGGGGGGAILIYGDELTGNLNVEAKGGKGGDIDNRNQNRCHGPGGGGGGGRFLGPSQWNVTVDLSGGAAGRSINSTASGCGAADNLAAKGEEGLRQHKTTGLEEGKVPFVAPKILNIATQLTACEGDRSLFVVETQGEDLQFQWQIQNGNDFIDLAALAPYVGVNTSQLGIDLVSRSLDRVQYRLRVTTSCGDLLFSEPIRLLVDQLPVADFSFTSNAFTVEFENGSSAAERLIWNFGDGESTDEQNPVHRYRANGEYEVSLIALNPCGADTLRQLITISAGVAPSAAFSYTSLKGCYPLQVQFQNESLGDYTDVLWRFTGGTPDSSTEEDPLVTFTESGIYSFALFISGPLGQDLLLREERVEVWIAPQADFTYTIVDRTVSFDNNSTGDGVYRWVFGDGRESTEENPVHTYERSGDYKVNLITDHECGTDTTSLTLNVNLAPKAAFSFSPADGCFPLSVQFINESVGDYTQLLWRFPGGEPNLSTDPHPVVTYKDSGTYTFSLLLSGGAGTDSLVVEERLDISTAPTADFDFTLEGLTVTFLNHSMGADNFQWIFGDEEESEAVAPVHTYPDLGNYEVILVAGNECGEDTLRQSLVIGQAPQALFTFKPSGGCVPAKIQFSNLSEGDYTYFEWSFPGGDPAVSNSINPQITYYEPGLYGFRLFVDGPLGSDQIEMEEVIEILPIPEPDFSYEIRGDSVLLKNNSTNARSYLWNFGDGSTSREQNPIHVFGKSGAYTITLNAGNTYCGKSISRQVQVVITQVEESLREAGISLYPNPVNDWVFIDFFENQYPTLHIQLLNNVGQNVKQWVINSPQALSLAGYPSGLYYVQIRSKAGQWFGRIIKR